jgi:hypothetical protein
MEMRALTSYVPLRSVWGTSRHPQVLYLCPSYHRQLLTSSL